MWSVIGWVKGTSIDQPVENMGFGRLEPYLQAEVGRTLARMMLNGWGNRIAGAAEMVPPRGLGSIRRIT